MRFTVTFTRLETDDLPALAKSGIFQEVVLTNIKNFAKQWCPFGDPEMECTVDVAAGSNLGTLDILNRRLQELPVCVFGKMSSIIINQGQE